MANQCCEAIEFQCKKATANIWFFTFLNEQTKHLDHHVLGPETHQENTFPDYQDVFSSNPLCHDMGPKLY